MRDPRSGGTTPCGSYLLAGDASLAEYLLPEGMTLIDLRALRPHAKLWQHFDETSRRLIWSFDAYVAIPDVAPATPIAAP